MTQQVNDMNQRVQELSVNQANSEQLIQQNSQLQNELTQVRSELNDARARFNAANQKLQRMQDLEAQAQ